MNKIAIIDLDSILYAAAWGNKIPDGEGGYLRDDKNRLIYKDKDYKEIEESIDHMFTSILQNTEATGYIAYVKGIKTGQHRYNAKGDYKSNRSKEVPKWWGFAKHYSIFKWNAYEVNYIEVDDAVNITKNNLENSFIVAVDKDLLNLEGTHYNWKTGEWTSKDSSQAEYLFWSDMIAGQSGDGVKGIPGKGEKYVERLFNTITEDQIKSTVFNEYILAYGEEVGIQEFYKNYTCLKILDKYEGFEIPEVIDYVKEGDGDKEESFF